MKQDATNVDLVHHVSRNSFADTTRFMLLTEFLRLRRHKCKVYIVPSNLSSHCRVRELGGKGGS